MKKLIVLIFLLFTPSLSFPDSSLYIYQDNKVIGKMSVVQFETLIEGADKYKEIIKAQQEFRVKIKAQKVIKTKVLGQYKTSFIVTWYNEENIQINYITSEMILNIDNEDEADIPEWQVIYRNVAELGFPISLGLLLIIIALL